MDYYLDHHSEYTIEDTVRIEQAVVKDEGKRIMQEAIFSWERREERVRQEGIQQGIQEIAKNLLNEGVDFGTICKCTGLSFDQVEQLQNGLKR